MRSLFSLNKYFFKYKWYLLGGMLCVTLTNVFAVVQPILVRQSFDSVKHILDQSGQSSTASSLGNTLAKFALLVIVMALLRGVFMFFMRQTIIVMSRHIEFDQRNEIYNHYQKLDISFYKKNSTGDLMARITEDVSRVRMYVGPVILYTTNLLVLIIMVVYVMFHVSPVLAMYVLLPLPLLSFTIYFVNNIIERRSDKLQKQLSTLSSASQEIISGIRIIKSFVQGQSMLNYFRNETEKYRERSLDLAQVESVYFPVVGLLVGLSTIIVLWIGGRMYLLNQISAGNIAEFILYVNMLIWPVTSLGWVASTLQRAAVSQSRINEFLQTNSSTDFAGTGEVQNGGLAFNNVSFQYVNTGIQALNHCSFSVLPGERLAILGSTGSGKSTLAQLILRMYNPDEGSIQIGGLPTKEIAVNKLRQEIGYVPQDVFLFSDTIQNNICFGVDEHVSQNEIERFAKIAGIHDEILRFKEGYQTIVGERGVTISGGQKQRISIARALLKNPKILLLDDCLSAVDENTSENIFNNLKTEFTDTTVLLITHRVQHTAWCNNIIVLENGEIIEQGTYSQLMKQGTKLFELYQKQNYKEELAL